MYIESFNHEEKKGYLFTIEKLEQEELVVKILAENIEWDSSANIWTLRNVYYRRFNGINEEMHHFDKIDTSLSVRPNDFKTNRKLIDIMNYRQLRDFIEVEKIKGVEGVEFYEVEKHKRIAFPFATIVLTMIGVALSSRKTRGGIGLHLAMGLLLSFSFILFMQISTTFSTNGDLSPFVAVWIPNVLFAIMGIYLLRSAPK
jgi:lipopolysaccharide export system permease protein